MKLEMWTKGLGMRLRSGSLLPTCPHLTRTPNPLATYKHMSLHTAHASYIHTLLHTPRASYTHMLHVGAREFTLRSPRLCSKRLTH